MLNASLLLYTHMTELLAEHRAANHGAYPLKFVLNLRQHWEYLCDVNLLGKELGKYIDPSNHMGVPIEIEEKSPGLMVNANGSELVLQEGRQP